MKEKQTITDGYRKVTENMWRKDSAEGVHPFEESVHFLEFWNAGTLYPVDHVKHSVIKRWSSY